MIHIKIITIGKNKEAWLNEALAEYEKRLQPFCKVQWILAKNTIQLEELSNKESKIIGLDPAGKLMTSEQFSKEILNLGSRFSFIIGGPDGLPPSLKKQTLWSLSPLTFTHQLTRLILLEQLYRAYEIGRGSPYHK